MVRTIRTATNQSVSAEDFLLTREAVVRFVQDSIANAVYREKRNADKHGRAKVLLYNVGDIVLLSTVNLPKHEVTNVGSSLLLSARSVYYIAKAMCTRSSCLAGCVRTLRFTSVFSARTITTRSLPRANTTTTLKNLQEIPLNLSQFLNLAP